MTDKGSTNRDAPHWTDELSDAEKALVAALSSGDEKLIMALEAQVELEDASGGRRPLPPLAAAALYYAARGLPVFPLQPLRKRPATKNGFKDATTYEEVVRAWWGRDPSFNIGIPTGIWFDVVDIDGPNGVRSEVDNHEAFKTLEVRAIVSTPRPGGRHHWIPPVGRGNGAKILPGIDYRGAGGYVVVPPSVLEELDADHPDGPQCAGTYTFIRPPVLQEVPR